MKACEYTAISLRKKVVCKYSVVLLIVDNSMVHTSQQEELRLISNDISKKVLIFKLTSSMADTLS